MKFVVPPRLYAMNPWRYRPPKGFIARFFCTMTPRLSGLIVPDNAEQCVDPWSTAMKWVEHMQMRGYHEVHVDHVKWFGKLLVIVAVGEKL